MSDERTHTPMDDAEKVVYYSVAQRYCAHQRFSSGSLEEACQARRPYSKSFTWSFYVKAGYTTTSNTYSRVKANTEAYCIGKDTRHNVYSSTCEETSPRTREA